MWIPRMLLDQHQGDEYFSELDYVDHCRKSYWNAGRGIKLAYTCRYATVGLSSKVQTSLSGLSMEAASVFMYRRPPGALRTISSSNSHSDLCITIHATLRTVALHTK